MNAVVEAAEEEAIAHERNGGAAIGFVGLVGLVHAGLLAWTGVNMFIEPPTMAAFSLLFVAIGAWMAFRPRG